MSASLVGSEMCIRDRCTTEREERWPMRRNPAAQVRVGLLLGMETVLRACLLYTSDAADDM
eukprot:2335447-Alexandrium_andersonii.AAC.1